MYAGRDYHEREKRDRDKSTHTRQQQIYALLVDKTHAHPHIHKTTADSCKTYHQMYWRSHEAIAQIPCHFGHTAAVPVLHYYCCNGACWLYDDDDAAMMTA